MLRFFRPLLSVVLVLLVLGMTVINAGAAPPVRQSAQQPRVLTGSHAVTNPVYATVGARVGSVLYDFSGYVRRDYDFYPPEQSQVLGDLTGDITGGTYRLELPAEALGEALDFDGDPATPPVQMFVTSTYIDFLGDATMERGELPLNMSAALDPMSYDITGGHVVVWAEGEGAVMPAGRGPDGVLFTADDPMMPLPAGWSVIALDEEPFPILRQETVDFPVIESVGGLYDYSNMSYLDAWAALFTRTQTTYPFTAEKKLDWDAIYEYVTPLVRVARSDLEFHLAIAAFGQTIPDTHIGYSSLPILQAFLIGGVGIRRLAVTDQEQVAVVDVVANGPANQAGIAPGDVLTFVDGSHALQVLDETPLLFGSASTKHGRRFFQAATMLQGPIDSRVVLAWVTPGGEKHTATLTRTMDLSSLLAMYDTPVSTQRVVEGHMLESSIGYINLRGFAEEVSEADVLFSSLLDELVSEGARGIIIDIRHNTGGLLNLAMSTAGYFFTDYQRLFDFYYADGQGGFAYRGCGEILVQEPYYDGPVAVLVDEMTGSAGEVFAYAMHTNQRALIVGYTPTGGFAGEVSDGQYEMPGGLSIQIPTGRPVDPGTGMVLIEGVGVLPDVRVPLTLDSLISPDDEVLLAAEEALLAQ